MSTAPVKNYKIHHPTRLMGKTHIRLPAHRLSIGFNLLNQCACVGLALFLTLGFAVSLSLFAGRSALDPGPISACAWFFTWCITLFVTTWNA
jgi:hypothetical protein